MPANPNLQKIIKLTPTQYDTLANGGTVGDFTGLNDNYLYLIQDTTEYVPISGNNIVDLTGLTAKVRKISAPTSNGGTTYGTGSNGQVLKSNGTTVYWASDEDNQTKTGSSNVASKIFLIGATSQSSTGVTTYSNSNVYVADSGTLYAVKPTDLSGSANNHPALIVGGTDTTAHIEVDSNEIQAKTDGINTADLHLNADGGKVYLTSHGSSSHKAYADGGYLYSNGTKVSVEGHTHSYAGSSSAGGAATRAEKLTNTSKIGDTNKPVYFTANGVPEAISYTIGKSVPSDAIFTDTKNTAGSSNVATKLFLTGASSQNANGLQTFSNENVYTEGGAIYAKGGNINTDTNNAPFYISRTGGTGEAVAHSVDDSSFHIDYTNDEAAANIKWQIINTDQERTDNKGADASTHYMQFSATKAAATLTVDGTAVALSNHTHLYAGSSTAGGKATSSAVADKLANTAAIGSLTNPVYFTSGGVPAACTYSLGANVPSDAIFTDTKNTAGSSNVANKLYLIGSTSQASSATAGSQTYSNSATYTQSGKLYSNNSEVVNLADDQTIAGKKTFSGPIYANHSDLTIIGTAGAFGLRAAAQSSQSVPHLGQINLSKNFGGDGNQYGIQLSAVDITNNKFNQFRVYQKGLAYNQYNITAGTTTDIFTVNTSGVVNANAGGKGLVFPSTTSWTDNKVIATVDDTLSSPYSIIIKAGTDKVSSYDGGSEKTFTWAASSTAGAFTISDGTTTKTIQLAGKFTDSDTKTTAGAANTPNTKLYLIGAQSTGTNPTTYANSNVYIGTDNCLYSNGTKVSVAGHTHDAYVNQNAYGKIKVSGGTAKTADETQDTIEFAASGDLGIARDGDKITYSYSTPASLKNPNNLAIRVNSETSDFITYDGSALKTITFKPHTSTKGALVISDGSTEKTIQLAGVFTDTKDTTGASSVTGTKLYLVGRASQSTGTSQSNPNCYIDTDNCLYSGGSKVLTAHPAITMGTDSTPAQSTLSHGGTFSAITGITKDSNGHVTAITTQSYKLPGSGNTNQTIKAKDSNSTDVTFGANETVEIVAGDNITITPNATSKTITIAGLNNSTVTGTENVSDTKLYLVGATAQTTSAATNTNSNCYIGSDNKLYSNGSVVLTSHKSHKIRSGVKADGSTNIDGSSTSNEVLELGASGVTANSYGPSTNATPSHGNSFDVPYITVNAKGIVTAASTKSITLPSDNDTKHTAGSANTANKLFLIGTEAQTTGTNSLQTYSFNKVYATNGQLNAGSFAFTNPDNVNASKAIMQYSSTEDCIEFVFA